MASAFHADLNDAKWKAELIDASRGHDAAVNGKIEKAVRGSPSPRVARKMIGKILGRPRERSGIEPVTLHRGGTMITSAAAGQMMDWVEEGPRLQAAETGVFHQTFERPLMHPNGVDEFDLDLLHVDYQVFLVQHDWAAAMERAHFRDDDIYRLPADHCCFEFRFSGRRVCALYWGKDGEPTDFSLLVDTPSGWMRLPTAMTWKKTRPPGWSALLLQVDAQVQAICITLDAEITETEVVRADHALNAARARRGKGPIFDHHILSLANRRRYAPRELEDDRVKTRVRLHYRRGHWRHFATFKTWVRWCWPGDPDLGFADKDYRL